MADNKDKIPVSPQVRAYMSRLGKKAGIVNKQKGSEYFRWVRSHGKTKAKKEDQNALPKPDSTPESD